MEYKKYLLSEICDYKTGRLNSNAAVDNGKYKFFTCAPKPLTIDSYSYDDNVILLAGNNANGIFHINRFNGKFDAYQRTYIIKPKADVIDIDYLYYFLKFKLNFLQSQSIGSATKYLTKPILDNLEVYCPEKKMKQKAISSILKFLDKKLELNKKIIANLEELSQTLFKRWFVDYEFPDENGNPYKSSGGEMIDSELGKIPVGWQVNNINDFANNNVITGKTPSTKVKENYSDTGIPFLTIPDMHNDIFVLNTERYISNLGIEKLSKKILPKNSLAISCIATPGLVNITSSDTLTNQQVNSFTPNKIELYYLYFNLKSMSNYIRDLGSGGSTTLNLNKTQFSKIKLLKPTNKLLLKYDNLVRSNFEMILNFQNENNYLTILRDTLLPKLMSGEIEIPDDIEVNEDELSI
ncbi:restriction endonuclease subunit S [Staphylococcus saprophyticus]|uniref:restriction endonuclease subunit S n=1 Tax=Staphylococcus saprophyticus TaxID=29385 RepID=UPI0034DDBCA8